MVRRLLFVSGVLSSAIYLVADIVCGRRYPNYSFQDQVISELSAIGAPTAALWATFLQVYAALYAAFTAAIIVASRACPKLRRAAWLMVVFVLSGPLWSFVPMHQRGAAFAWTDAGHIVMGALMVLLLTALMIAGTNALDDRFRRLWQPLVGVAGLAGVGTFAYVPRMIHQLPTPGVGVIERLFLYGFLVWTAAWALALHRLAPAGRHAD